MTHLQETTIFNMVASWVAWLLTAVTVGMIQGQAFIGVPDGSPTQLIITPPDGGSVLVDGVSDGQLDQPRSPSSFVPFLSILCSTITTVTKLFATMLIRLRLGGAWCMSYCMLSSN